MSYELSIGLFLIAILISRVLAEKALRSLSSEEKVRLIDAFSGMRAFNLIPIVCIFGAYYYALHQTSISYNTINILYLVVLFLFLVVNFMTTQSKLKSLELPISYLKFFGLSRTIQYIATGLLLVVLFGNVL